MKYCISLILVVTFLFSTGWAKEKQASSSMVGMTTSRTQPQEYPYIMSLKMNTLLLNDSSVIAKENAGYEGKCRSKANDCLGNVLFDDLWKLVSSPKYQKLQGDTGVTIKLVALYTADYDIVNDVFRNAPQAIEVTVNDEKRTYQLKPGNGPRLLEDSCEPIDNDVIFEHVKEAVEEITTNDK